MEKYTTLQRTVLSAKSGDEEAFETMFILTYGETYYLTHSILRAQAGAVRLLSETYVELYRRLDELPLEEDSLFQWINQVVLDLALTRWRVKEENFPPVTMEKGMKERLPDEKVAMLWVLIDERIFQTRQAREPKPGPPGRADYVVSGLRIALTVVLVAGSLAVMAVGWNSIRQSSVTHLVDGRAESMENHNIQIQEELPKAGWSRRDGMLYYVKRDQTVAAGDVTIGKQILSFSEEGQLVDMRDNGKIAYQNGVCFDEDIRYEVVSGDIYRKTPDGKDNTCVVRNGHVVYVNLHDKHLNYICQYQIPNSERVRTVLMQSRLDGTEALELKELNPSVMNSRMQVSGKYLYYMASGKLLRENLEDGTTLVMASGVTQYYPKGGTVYYMDGGQMVKASSGTPYEETHKSYYVELSGEDILLKDQSGEPAAKQEEKTVQIGDRNLLVGYGKVEGVSPASRTFGDISYQQNQDRKLTWKAALGVGGLIKQSGMEVDSFCIADQWLYYSARLETDRDGMVKSRIYRLNLTDSQEEAVSEAFDGYMENLYYIEDTEEIYGEYLPSPSPGRKGRIAVIPVGGGVSLVAEGKKRPKGMRDGDSKLEFVTAQEGQVYCIFRDRQWDKEQEAWKSVESKPVVLESVNREAFDTIETKGTE